MNKLLLIFSFHSLVSIFSVIYLNLIFFCYRFILKKKIIFFYHPKTNLVKIHEYYINDLFNQIRKDYKVIYGIQPEKNFKISVKKSFFIKQGLLKWLLNIDIFISQNVCDVFTNKSKRIYIHHCVYDTPLASKIKEKKLVQRLSMYDHILLSSKDAENNTIREINFYWYSNQNAIKYGSLIRYDINIEHITDIFSHIIECVERSSRQVRPQSDWNRSLSVLQASIEWGLKTKTGMMVGLGENDSEVLETMQEIADL